MIEPDALLIIDGATHRVVAVDDRRLTATRAVTTEQGETKTVTVTCGVHAVIPLGDNVFGLEGRIDVPRVNPAAVQARPAQVRS